MKSKIYIISAILLFVLGASCSSKQKTTKKVIPMGDSSLTSLDWDGTYQGILPCGDCEGIQTQIVLSKDLSYVLETRYIAKDEKIFQTKGTFKWDATGSKIILDNSGNQMYLVGENRLIHLDSDGKKITGDLAENYIHEKEKTELTGKYWRLSELNGQPVKPENREPFITFYKEENRVNGNNSCNTFNGKYEISDGNKIKFSPFMMTRMACIDNKTEDEFMKALEISTVYSVTEKTLILSDSENQELAKFEAVFFK